MDFRAFWTKFRKTVYFRFAYLLLISTMGALLLPSALGCLALLLVTAAILLVPHSFGERRIRNHAANGVFCLILISVLYAAIAVPEFRGYQQFELSGSDAGTSIAHGYVAPFRGDAATRFNFTANVTSTTLNASQIVVNVVVYDYEGLGATPHIVQMTWIAGSDKKLQNGENYYANISLRPVVHKYGFAVLANLTSTDIVTATLLVPGPNNAPDEAYWSVIFLTGLVGVILLGFFYFLILLLYWWTRKAKEIRGAAGRPPEPARRAEGGGEFTCTNCGADVSEDATKCPKCGATFEAEAEGEAPVKA